MLGRIKEVAAQWRARTTLGQQVTLYMGLLCVVLVGALGLTAAEVARQQGISRVQSQMISFASSTADRLHTYLTERARDITDIADVPVLKKVWAGDSAVIRSVLEHQQSIQPDFVWIGLARPDGTVTAATGGMLEGQSVAGERWFISGAKDPMIGDVHRAGMLAPLLGPNKLGQPYQLIDVAVPVHDEDGKFVGVLAGMLSWTWVSDMRAMVLSRLDPKLKTDFWILNTSGEVLLGPEHRTEPFDAATLERIRTEGRRTFTDTVGASVLTSALLTAPMGPEYDLRWIVVARRPLAAAFAEANGLATAIGSVGLMLGGVGVLLAILLARHIARPLRALAEHVDLIGRDPKTTMVPRQSGSVELAQLSGSIRSLLRRVAVAEGAELEARRSVNLLESRIEQKTRQMGEHISTLQVLADTDPLTHLLNRRAFMVFAVDAMVYFRRHGHGVGVMVIDIDLFKRVNDIHGHAVGDEVIRSIAATINTCIRATDKVARFGGEEFVVLLRETDSEGAFALAERIRETVADSVIDTHSDMPVHVTISIGLAMAGTKDRDIEDVIERADRALYRAKQQGRNMVATESSVRSRSSEAA